MKHAVKRQGVVIVIDWESSTTGSFMGMNYIDLAKQYANQALGALSSQDYCSVMLLQNSYKNNLQFFPMTDKQAFLNSFNSINSNVVAGNKYRPALEYAANQLSALQEVGRRHVVILTDGNTSDTYANYSVAIEQNLKNGITTSFVLVNSSVSTDDFTKAAALGRGSCYSASFLNVSNYLK